MSELRGKDLVMGDLFHAYWCKKESNQSTSRLKNKKSYHKDTQGHKTKKRCMILGHKSEIKLEIKLFPFLETGCQAFFEAPVSTCQKRFFVRYIIISLMDIFLLHLCLM